MLALRLMMFSVILSKEHILISMAMRDSREECMLRGHSKEVIDLLIMLRKSLKTSSRMANKWGGF